jgi:Ca2+-binding RTX toxin-like protein
MAPLGPSSDCGRPSDAVVLLHFTRSGASAGTTDASVNQQLVEEEDMRFKSLLVLAALAAGAMAFPSASFASSCVYDPATRSVAVTMDEGQTEIVYVGNRGTIESGSTGTCGAATIGNTDRIMISGGTAAGSESLTISQHNGALAREKGAKKLRTEIKVTVDLVGGDSSSLSFDTLTVVGTARADRITLGSAGLDLNSDGDLDISVANDPRINVELGDGVDTFTAQGGVGAGSMYTSAQTLSVWGATEFQPVGALDEAGTITGRDGRDLLYGSGTLTNTITGLGGDDGVFGSWGDDFLSGGAGADSIGGDNGNDTMSGGDDNDVMQGGGQNDTIGGDAGDDMINGEPGQDTLHGGSGNDFIQAQDGERDTVDGGADLDRAFVDSVDTCVNVEECFS